MRGQDYKEVEYLFEVVDSHSIDTMNHFYIDFEYLQAHRIAVCKTHRHGIIKSQLQTHLDTKHPGYVPSTRRRIVAAVQDEASMRQWAITHEEVVYPVASTQALPHLPVYRDGLRCAACPYINRDARRMRDHCKQEHGWKSQRQSARGRPSATGPAWTTVTCQKFHNAGPLGRLFEIGAAVEVQRTEDPDMDVGQAIELSLTQAATQLDERDKQEIAAIRADTDRYDFNEWLNRAGWARHLKGLKRDWLLAMSRKPSGKERALADVCWAVEMVIWKAQQVSHSGVVGMPAMIYINRRECGNSTSEKPFNASQTGKTMVKYSNVWKEIIAYIWRTHELAVVTPASNQEVEGRRPPYHITGRQDACLDRIKAIVGRDREEEEENWFDEEESDSDVEERLDEQQQEALQGHVHEFMLALLDHVLSDNEYSSALISGMAVLGISTESGWLSPLVYTPKQSAIVSTSRMIVLYKSTQMRQAEIEKLARQGYSAEDAAAMAPGHYQFVQEMASRFMTLTEYSGKPTPIDAILRLRSFGFKIRFTTNAEGVIDWSGDTLLYGNIQFSMGQLRSMIHGMMASARQQILKELMLLQLDRQEGVKKDTTACPTIDWGKLVDNAAEQQVGWNFMEDPRNKNATSVEEPKNWLAQRITNEKALQRQFIDVGATRTALGRGGGVVWVKERVQAYAKSMKNTRHALAALVHMTGGAPPRGSELVSVKYKNSANGDSRGIFIEDGEVVFVTKYHKNIGQTGKGKVIHRYVPREVGELVVFYLWFSIPFWQQINAAVQGVTEKGSAYVWEPQPEKSWEKPERKRKRDEEERGRTRRVGRGSRVRVVGRRESPDEAWEEGVGGGGLADEDRNVELWNSNRVKAAIQKESLQHMGVNLTIMGWRHGTKAMYRRYIHNHAAVKAFLDADAEEGFSDGEDEAFDIQTGHSSSVAGGIYGRPLTEAVFSVEAKRFGLRLASMEWHAFLQIPSALEKKPRRGTQAAAARKEAIEEEYRRWKMMRLVDVDSELKRLMGEQATFRSVQRPAMQAIMQHKSPVVVIMGTGAGKSLLFMLPASVSSGLTIVVVPLVALRFDMKERCEQLGIASAEWDSRRPHESAQIMFVTPEAAVGEAFGHYINRQRAMGRLDRIVVDECHVVLDSLGGFRSQMLALRRLVRVETQMVYLTATLRPSEEKQFIEVMGLPGKKECAWFRGQTTRKNIQYRIEEYNAEEEEQAIVELVEGLKKKYPLPGQIIVYCETVARTVQMAGVLGAVCYHREVGSVEKKKEIVRQLTGGQEQVFTATNALGLGVDAPTIRAVVHVGRVRKMRQYAQESGRAGRDGGRSEAIVMRGYRVMGGRRVFGKFGKEVEEEVIELMEGSGCIRRVIDLAMDGAEQRWECEEGEACCQRCEGTRGGGEERREEVGGEGSAERMEFEQQRMGRRWVGMFEAERQSREAQEVQELVELMSEWRVGCQWCRGVGRNGVGHELEDCEAEEAEEARVGLRKFEEIWVGVPFSCCYECRLPQAVCSSFEGDVEEGGYRKVVGGQCQYLGVLTKVFVVGLMRGGMVVYEELERAMEEDGGMREVAMEEVGGLFRSYVRWGSEKKRWGGIEGNKLSWAIGRIVGCM